MLPTVRSALSKVGSQSVCISGENGPGPVFLLAAGWRSGSTLLQRLLMPWVFVWGEPYGHACPIPALADTIRCFTDFWPEPHFFYQDQPPAELQKKFIANLYPSVETLREVHRAWFRTLFEEPAGKPGRRVGD